MIEPSERSNLILKHDEGHWIVIPTNGYIDSNGLAVMGRGLALEVSTRYPILKYVLGMQLKAKGNHVFRIDDLRMFTFPVKNRYWENAEPNLIVQSSKEIIVSADNRRNNTSKIYIPRVGCGNGKLEWSDVKQLISPILDDRFVICDLAS